MRWGVIALSLLVSSCAGGAAVVESSPATPTTEANPPVAAVTSTSVADESLSISDLETGDLSPEEEYSERALAASSAREGSDASPAEPEEDGDGSAGGESLNGDAGAVENQSTDESSTDDGPEVALGSDGLSGDLLNAIMADAADRLGVEVSAVEVVSIESKTFNDASLGCTEFGTSYTQVITPGHIVLVEGAGSTLDYRVNDLHGTFEVCE